MKVLPEIEEARRQDAKDNLHNSVVNEEIELLEDQIQKLQLKKKGTQLLTEKGKVISSQNVYTFINKPVKFLLSRLNRNTKLLDKRNDMAVLNEQLLITNALTLKVMKSNFILHEIESFKNEDLLLERTELFL